MAYCVEKSHCIFWESRCHTMKHNHGHPILILFLKIRLPSVGATETWHFAKVSLHSCRHKDLLSKSRFVYESQFLLFRAIISCFPSMWDLLITYITHTKTTRAKKQTFYYTIPNFRIIHFMDFDYRLKVKKRKKVNVTLNLLQNKMTYRVHKVNDFKCDIPLYES